MELAGAEVLNFSPRLSPNVSPAHHFLILHPCAKG